MFEYGIWDFLFMNVDLKKQGPIGFYEVMEKLEGFGFALVAMNPTSKEKQIIDTVFFNRGWSMVETRDIVQEAAVSIVL